MFDAMRRPMAALLAAAVPLLHAAERAPGAAIAPVYALAENTLVEAAGVQAHKASFFAYDGSGWSALRDGDRIGPPRPLKWYSRSDGRFCTHAPERSYREADCRVVAVDGDRASWTGEDGRAGTGQVLAGDAWNLEQRWLQRPVRALAGRDAVEALIGRTFVVAVLGDDRPSGTESGAYRFEPRGRGQMLVPDPGNSADRIAGASLRSFRWTFTPERGLCIGVEERSPEQGDCRSVRLTGDRMAWRMSNGGGAYGRVLAGDPRRLSAPAREAARRLRARLVGQTLVVRHRDRPERERGIRLLPDGEGRVALRGAGSAGTVRPLQWLLRDDLGLLCLSDVPASVRRLEFTANECFGVEADGDILRLQPRSGTALTGRILAGNAWDL
ncbi:hypothetical protein [Lysobacter antibioticus]|uniref:hypothetical protein n=1 Tax=Lysobacter antibioticus TaxID=84531 RepID=UPI000347C16D|nr:hypothetical protein [Lysobacter antibioticus]